ncbi:alpha/beta fold hydrolase [Paraburkholderia phenazinium]|jgi:pimeloyl-ACP methyl ester carboxylesterase|uniref:Pimeloyl-ACP methyl ester carboxylesterase n=1 Tax=Paraburkholderia phenazinium TaxID=60549 RepID=A0A1G7U104_9BURK|nr:alpha/beta hydrolase [Paraburkholderia phenazinium]SDG41295.1 Pimeloyl-ACP methyl ester carboxylesterase [Paraburkholderia phenazinium]
MGALQEAMREAAASGIRFGFAETNGLRMHYARKGHGKTLVLLHGWPEFWIVYRPLLERLEDEFDVIVPDLRGFGFTGKPFAGPDPHADANTHARDIAGLLDALGIASTGIVGGDLGAYVLQAFARHYPQRLERAFFFCTPYPGIGTRYGAPGHLIEVWYQYFQQLPWAAELIGASRQTCKLYLSHFLNHWSGDAPDVFANMLEIYTDMFMQNDNIQGGFDWYLSSAPDRRRWLEGTLAKPPVIDAPSRFLWGWHDPLIKPDWSDKLGDYFSNYSIGFADAGHFVHYEAPDLCASEIRSFFAAPSRHPPLAPLDRGPDAIVPVHAAMPQSQP